MYDQFYGLKGRPFQLTPDPHFYFESATHRKALSYLGYGLAQGEGFIVITGDIGAGKTTLVGHVMASIDPARLTAVKIVSTQVEGDDMLRLAAQAFGVQADGVAKAEILNRIEGFLHSQARAGRRTLLIVDEAQNLPVSAIEELRMLSNFQLGGQALLQIFLLGQPEFRDLMASPGLEQLRQRVIATHHLDPMLADEVQPYIEHRLGLVGWQGNPRFTPEACAAIHAATGGIPRRVNAVVSRVLLLGAIDRLDLIDTPVVDAVVADMSHEGEVAEAAPQAAPVSAPVATPVRAVPDSPPAEAVAAPAPSSADLLDLHRIKAELDELRAALADRSGAGDLSALFERLNAVEKRLAVSEQRAADQDAALRQVLTLLVEWVEREDDVALHAHDRAA
ncbi:XrtA/PEP-CTERM system-associated ATPase [Sphingobium phenoxybenzoativorans]|uniref:XrtA/PEP-CTERM system-associated ATPase n=1 Tax=Sphingobium phenoxybenzoativorans TaxID=1592790 RepID=UPI0008727CEF|nr:XrtA/PEP-CTERM system-associated ATPase [Sphingobium phenoxybenzoativorans]